MNLMSYNTRGLGSSEKHRTIRKLVRKGEIELIMLQETKLANFQPRICSKIWPSDGYNFAHSDSVGRSGGLLMIWETSKFNITNSVCKKNYMALTGQWVSSGSVCTFINVYGPSSVTEKRDLWSEISEVIRNLNHCICIAGDFNSILDPSERKSRSPNPHLSGMNDFRSFVSSNGLMDIPLANRRYTWFSPDYSTRTRLDRFLINPLMASEMGNCTQIAIQRSISDHSAIVLRKSAADWGPSPFRAINAWTSHQEFIPKVKELWSSFSINGWKGFAVKEKIKLLRKGLQVWNRDTFGNIETKISEVLSSIQHSDLKAEVSDLSEDEIQLKKDEFLLLWNLLRQRERLDCQKARSKHITYGDCNSKYFHNQMRVRQRKNCIPGIFVNGDWVDNPVEVKEAIKNHFSNQFSEKLHHRPSIQGLNFKQLSTSQRDQLEADFTVDEIREAVKNCGSEKAPGPDGFSFLIIKHIWEVIESDVVDFVMEFHGSGRIVKGLNASFIVLVPKKSNPTSLDDYRPISLIGCLYKILAKLLANRLRKVIGSVISNTQTAFLSGRQILDGVLALNEAIHDLKERNRSGFILKADFSKAFDCVSWNYLDSVQEAMGFGQKWRVWIQSCLSSASISVLINGSTTDVFTTSKGLRQGDPLSPFLFLIAAEGLNVLMDSAIALNEFSGVRIGAGVFRLSHLQYADDTILLGEKSWKNIYAAKFILKWFEIISGLSINFNKSKLICVNCPPQWTSEAARILQCKVENLPTSYLGLPVGSSHRRYSFWVPVIQRVEKKLSAWKSRLLSAGARVTLVKSVLSSLPLYFCSLFKMPTIVVKKINSLIRSFFWGELDSKRRTKWVSWEKICLHKNLGGLGVPDIKKKNVSLLAKWWHRFSTESNALWKRVIVEKYYCNYSSLSPFLHETNRVSKCWKDIVCIGDFQVFSTQGAKIRDCFKWILGNGALIRFWHDSWAADIPLKILFPRVFALSVNKDATVSNMGSYTSSSIQSWSWNIETFSAPRGRTLFEFQELSRLISNRSPSFQDDAFTWSVGHDPRFTTAALYDLLSPSLAVLPTDIIDLIWLKWSPPRVKIFIWKMAHNALPVNWNLLCRGIIPRDFDPMCSLCNSDLETQDHIFLQCPKVILLWRKIQKWWEICFTTPDSIANFLQQCQAPTTISGFNSLFQTVCVCTLWSIWFGRNNRIFNNVNWDVDGIFHFIQSRTYAWLRGLAPEKTFTPSDWFLYPFEVAKMF